MFIEFTIALCIVLPALILALTRSSFLVDYAILVIAFNRGIRRLVDYYVHEQFNPLSLISATPLAVGALLILPLLINWKGMSSRVQLTFVLLFFAIGYGFLVGLVSNGLSAVFSLGEWLSGAGAMAFAAGARVSQTTAIRWIKTAGWAAIFVSIYGWYQYLTIPPWDAFWVESVGFVGYLGELEPMKMTVFSTMASRGPCASFIAWAAIPMILDKRWRNMTGWLGVLLIVSCIFLTMTRTTLIIVVLISVLKPVLSGGHSIVSVAIFAALFAIVASYGMKYMPGGDRLTERYATLGDMKNDGSYQGRMEIYSHGIGGVLRNPIGYGLGSSGMGSRLGSNAKTSGDSGYLQMFEQFGWLGAICFFVALGRVWFIAGRFLADGYQDPFTLSGQSILLGCFVFLFVGDIFSGFSIYWLIFGRCINPQPCRRRIVTTSPAIKLGAPITI